MSVAGATAISSATTASNTLTLGKVSEDEARSKSDQVNCLLMRLNQRLIELPPGIDVVKFVQFDGKPPA
jgi:hypothetical protein